MLWVIPRLLLLEDSISSLPTQPVSRGVKPDVASGPTPGLALFPAGCLLPWGTGPFPSFHSGQDPWEGDLLPSPAMFLCGLGGCHCPRPAHASIQRIQRPLGRGQQPSHGLREDDDSPTGLVLWFWGLLDLFEGGCFVSEH